MFGSSRPDAGVLMKEVGESTVFKRGREVRCIMSECQECKMKERILHLEKSTTDQEARIKTLEEKSNKDSAEKKEFYRRFDVLTLDNQRHDMNIGNIYEKLESIDKKVCTTSKFIEEINNRPIKKVDKFSSAIISAIGSAVGVAIIGLIARMII